MQRNVDPLTVTSLYIALSVTMTSEKEKGTSGCTKKCSHKVSFYSYNHRVSKNSVEQSLRDNQQASV